MFKYEREQTNAGDEENVSKNVFSLKLHMFNETDKSLSDICSWVFLFLKKNNLNVFTINKCMCSSYYSVG